MLFYLLTKRRFLIEKSIQYIPTPPSPTNTSLNSGACWAILIDCWIREITCEWLVLIYKTERDSQTIKWNISHLYVVAQYNCHRCSHFFFQKEKARSFFLLQCLWMNALRKRKDNKQSTKTSIFSHWINESSSILSSRVLLPQSRCICGNNKIETKEVASLTSNIFGQQSLI